MPFRGIKICTRLLRSYGCNILQCVPCNKLLKNEDCIIIVDVKRILWREYLADLRFHQQPVVFLVGSCLFKHGGGIETLG